MKEAELERTWRAEIYSGPCKHNGKGKEVVTQAIYGTAHCPVCDASRGLDNRWRILVDIPKSA